MLRRGDSEVEEYGEPGIKNRRDGVRKGDFDFLFSRCSLNTSILRSGDSGLLRSGSGGGDSDILLFAQVEYFRTIAIL